MSVFDQPYYALTKTYMSRIGIWPEQSKYVKIILPLTIVVIILTLTGPMLIRLHDVWRDINILIDSTTTLLIEIEIVIIMFTSILHVDHIKLLLKKIEEHWEILKNTPAVIVLDKYAEQGRYITIVYSRCSYIVMILYLVSCLSPIILDFVNPVNQTRQKIYIVEAAYGVDEDKYYWLIIAHTYIVVAAAITVTIAIATMYILLVIHACALFEVVGFNLELTANKCTVNKENAITLRITYKKICNCIIFHAEAISFANLVETVCCGCCGVLFGIVAMIIIMSGVQVLINWKNAEVLMQRVPLMISQVFHLYMFSIPGQELINRSGKIRTTAYNLDWPDMSTNTQKLLIPILMRSNKPCCFTAGKFYVLSMETFGSAIRIIISYFTMFAQMI